MTAEHYVRDTLEAMRSMMADGPGDASEDAATLNGLELLGAREWAEAHDQWRVRHLSLHTLPTLGTLSREDVFVRSSMDGRFLTLVNEQGSKDVYFDSMVVHRIDSEVLVWEWDGRVHVLAELPNAMYVVRVLRAGAWVQHGSTHLYREGAQAAAAELGDDHQVIVVSA